MVPRNPIQAAANMDMLGVIFFALMFGQPSDPAGESRPMLRALDALGAAIVRSSRSPCALPRTESSA
jgi:DAACS family dicarboxylate/amino acid:cation (Na+ or H+) symporter